MDNDYELSLSRSSQVNWMPGIDRFGAAGPSMDVPHIQDEADKRFSDKYVVELRVRRRM